MESWDDENFEPPAAVPSLVKSNKWVGEDEEEDVKESWEDEDEEKKEEEENKPTEEKKKNKKKLAQIIAEKEAKKREEFEQRLREQQEEEISPEEKIRMEKESDLKLALETTFGQKGAAEEDAEIGGLKLPSTTEEFEEFTESLSKQLTQLARHGNDYVTLAEGLTRNLCAIMSSTDIKRIRNSLDNLFLEKQKMEKGDKSKKNKGKGKAKLKLEGENAQLSAYGNEFEYDDYDDFM